MLKKRVVVIFGGKSAEHEISTRSAKNIFEYIDRDKYEVFLLGINKLGQYFFSEDKILFDILNDSVQINYNNKVKKVAFELGKKDFLINLDGDDKLPVFDVAFPITHGTYGEDGCLQGFLRLLSIPFVGPDVLGASVGMDKDVMRKLLEHAKILGAKNITSYKKDINNIDFDLIKDSLGLPVFIKPANLGSSVGIHKVETKEEFFQALEDAFQYDFKVVIEEFIKGQEIECAVLGNEEPKASTVGEVVTNKTHDFYSYEAKYLDEKGAVLEIPAKLSEDKILEIRKIAIKTYQVLNLQGLARVDFFVNENGVYLNEVNTLPGFTSISMYPKLWEESGIVYKDLITELLQLAILKSENNKKLKTDFI